MLPHAAFRMQFVQRALLMVGLILSASWGCARPPQPPPPLSAAQGLAEMPPIYKYIEYSKIPLPRRPEDFDDFIDSMPNALARLKSGEYIVAWGIGLSQAPGAADQILAYEKKAPTEGGAVLLRNGTIKEVTVAEFSAAPKAR